MNGYLPPNAPDPQAETAPQHVGAGSMLAALFSVLCAWVAWGGAVWIFWNLGVVGAFDAAEPISILTADGLAIMPLLTFMLLFRIAEASRGRG